MPTENERHAKISRKKIFCNKIKKFLYPRTEYYHHYVFSITYIIIILKIQYCLYDCIIYNLYNLKIQFWTYIHYLNLISFLLRQTSPLMRCLLVYKWILTAYTYVYNHYYLLLPSFSIWLSKDFLYKLYIYTFLDP